MTIATFPSKLPSPQQLELPRAQLCALLHELTNEVMARQLDLMKAGNASEFAAAVRQTAAKMAEASAGWTEMSNTIRKSWHV
jgi:hypothetical protein